MPERYGTEIGPGGAANRKIVSFLAPNRHDAQADGMTPDDFIEATLSNQANRAIVRGIAELQLPDAWVVAGCLVQTGWNVLTGRPLTYGINDYDVFYFDPDTSWEAEDAIIKRIEQRLAALQVRIETRNQARVHLWYQQRHGQPYRPLKSSTQGIDRFLTTNTQIGIRRAPNGYEIYAPHGLDDAMNMIVRPNWGENFSAANYEAKAARWKALWPEITVYPADSSKTNELALSRRTNRADRPE